MASPSMMEKAQTILSEVTDLPTIPVVASRVLQLLDQPDVELEAVADMILTDQVLAARVIKIVNSPLYRPSHEIKSLKRALIYLGFRHIRELTLTCSFIEAFTGKSGVFDIKTFWEHSFGVGIVSKIIAQRVRFPDTEKAYIAGIVHDIGEVLLSHHCKEDFAKVIELTQRTTCSLVEAEQQVLGTTHRELGYCLATKWSFPDEYCEVIGQHHTPQEATINPPLTAIVNLADLFCSVRRLDYGGKEWVSFNLSEERAWEILQSYAPHMTDFDVERFCFELDDRIPEVQELVKSIFENVLE